MFENPVGRQATSVLASSAWRLSAYLPWFISVLVASVLAPSGVLVIGAWLDPNGASFDIVISLDPDQLDNGWGDYWFDPDPNDSLHDIPSSLVDGMFFMVHEIGHAIAGVQRP